MSCRAEREVSLFAQQQLCQEDRNGENLSERQALEGYKLSLSVGEDPQMTNCGKSEMPVYVSSNGCGVQISNL